MSREIKFFFEADAWPENRLDPRSINDAHAFDGGFFAESAGDATGDGTAVPSPIGRPSILTTGTSSPIVPVQKTSSARWNWVRETSASWHGMPMARQISRTTVRVIPSGQATVQGVSTSPLATRKTWVALVSATKPRARHEGVVRAGGVGLNLREDRRNQVVVMDFRVEAVRRGAATALVHERDSLAAVHRRFMLGEDDQRRPGLIQRGSMPDVTLTPRVSVKRI